MKSSPTTCQFNLSFLLTTSMVTLTLLLFRFMLFCCMQPGIRPLSLHSYWREIGPNFNFSHLDPVGNIHAHTISSCALLSLTWNITAFGYRTTQPRCHLYHVDSDNTHIWSPCPVPGFQFFVRNEDKIDWGGWQLVFRAQRDINSSVYSTWMDDNTYHRGPLSGLKPECLSMSTTLPCDIHYKSKVVTKWEESGIERVQILLVKDSLIKQEITFNGIGTNKTSWFSADHIINSTWTDLSSSTFNYFSIKGDLTRRFFINHNYGGCGHDYSWMTVVDGSGSHPCSWDNPSSIPKFMYSTKNVKTKDMEYGDVMAILVK